jgi:hypothetical protein
MLIEASIATRRPKKFCAHRSVSGFHTTIFTPRFLAGKSNGHSSMHSRPPLSASDVPGPQVTPLYPCMEALGLRRWPVALSRRCRTQSRVPQSHAPSCTMAHDQRAAWTGLGYPWQMRARLRLPYRPSRVCPALAKGLLVSHIETLGYTSV